MLEVLEERKSDIAKKQSNRTSKCKKEPNPHFPKQPV